MKFPWRDIDDIIKKKDFDAFIKRSRWVNLIYFIMGEIIGIILWGK